MMRNKLYRRTNYRNTEPDAPGQSYTCPNCNNLQTTFIAHLRKEIDEVATDLFTLNGEHSGFQLSHVKVLRYQLDYICCPDCRKKITGNMSDPLRRMVFDVYTDGR